MMNKVEYAFLKSHIKTAIFELQVANKLKPGTIDEATIVELKIVLQKLEENQMGDDE